MSRNSSGVYALPPSVNPVVSGTVITDEWANTTLEDVAAELTNSLDRYGRGGMLAPFRNADGTNIAPGITWANETTTGFYRDTPLEVALAIGTTEVMRWKADGITVPAGVAFEFEDLDDSPFLPLTGGVLTGNLGIKATPHPGNIATKTVLEIGYPGSGFSTQVTSRTLSLTVNAYESATGWRYVANGSAFAANFSEGSFTFFRSVLGGGVADATISFFEIIRSLTNGTVVIGPAATGPALSIDAPGDNGNHIQCLGPSANPFFRIIAHGPTNSAYIGTQTNSSLQFQTNGATRILLGDTSATFFSRSFIDSNGDLHVYRGDSTGVVYLGNQSGGDRYLWYNGSVYTFPGVGVEAASFNATSSRSMKENVRPYERGALDRVRAWDIVDFDFINGSKNMIGLIAEDADLRIREGKSINTTKALWELAAAVQELYAKQLPC